MSYTTVNDWTTAIADAIRGADGSSGLINHQDFPSRIAALGGDSLQAMIENGSYYGTYSISDTSVTRVGDYGLTRRTKLVSLDLPNCTFINDYGCSNCTVLASVNLPSITGIGKQGFYGCSQLTEIDLKSQNFTSISNYAFGACSRLSKIIIRRTSGLVSLANTDALSSTPIASGNGYIYVPDDLLTQYKGATNWSTYAAQIKGLSELPA